MNPFALACEHDCPTMKLGEYVGPTRPNPSYFCPWDIGETANEHRSRALSFALGDGRTDFPGNSDQLPLPPGLFRLGNDTSTGVFPFQRRLWSSHLRLLFRLRHQ